MTYEEVQEILSSKKNIPYPKLMNIRQNTRYANLLYDNFAGEEGELTAVNQYIYEHIELKRYESFSKILLSIAMEEMHHLDLIGDLIKRLGRKPYYINKDQCMWSANNIKYHFSNVYDMLMFNIELEKKSIERYKEAIKYTQNKSIKDLLERIILDEQTHLEIFNRLK